MNAGDSLGSCRHRGEDGHLPHPDGRPCITNSDSLAGAKRPDALRYGLANDVADLERRLAEALADRDHQQGKQRELVRMLEEVTEGRDRARRELEQAQREARENREDHQRACQLVAELYEAGTERRGMGPQRGVVEDVQDERHNLRGRAEAAERALASAREQAAECMREVAQLHRQLDSLGVDPERLASMVGAGQAVELFGRVYVARELLDEGTPGPTTGYDDGNGMQVNGQLELLEADSGVFVPIPKGHMLSVTVTPYEDQPAD